MDFILLWRGSKTKLKVKRLLAVFVHIKQIINFLVLNHIS